MTLFYDDADLSELIALAGDYPQPGVAVAPLPVGVPGDVVTSMLGGGLVDDTELPASAGAEPRGDLRRIAIPAQRDLDLSREICLSDSAYLALANIDDE